MHHVRANLSRVVPQVGARFIAPAPRKLAPMPMHHLMLRRSASVPSAALALLALSLPRAAPCAPVVRNTLTTIEAVGAPGAWTGVAVRSGDETVASIDLCSEGRWQAVQASADGMALTLRGFDTSRTGNAPTLAGTSFVRFALVADEPFPLVSFRLDLTAFDASAWETAWPQRCPVHFLSCSIDQPEFYYFHGLLAPTPRVDPYPFSWRDMRSNWADGWSTAPAIAALTVPAMALWRPSTGRLVAYCFQDARSTDRSDCDISVAYHWAPDDKAPDAFSLIWPYQRGWNELTYPTVPSTVESRFDLLYDLDTGPTGDVNRLVFDHIWKAHRDTLPTVPRMNDLGWMVERHAFSEGAPGVSIFGRVPKSSGSFCSNFFRDDTQVFGGSFRAVDLAYRRGDERAIEGLRRDVETMLSRAVWETIDGDECVYWKYPSEGGWEDWIGGERADTTRNVQQFGFAGALLAMYLHEPSDRLWRYVEGLYNWSRHYVYTRGDICDIPCSMFTLQTSQLALNFLMNLHYSLRDDPDPHKRQIAQQAFDLAVTVVWRNANVTTADPDTSDTLDPTFLMPGNQARFWLGQVSWAELCDVFRSMIVMYAETGDPRFKYYVRGALDKWWTGFDADGYHTAENLDVFGETAGKGKRTGLHGPQDSFWEWAQPVGDAILHVTGGRKAAIAFCKGTTSLDVSDYRFREPANFAFHVSGKHEGPFRMIFSSPYRDLSNLSVKVNGEPATDVETAGAYHEHLFLTAEAGALVEIDDVGDAKALPPEPVPTHPSGFHALDVQKLGLRCLDLGPHTNSPVNRDWSQADSWAGLSAGMAYADGVPYIITDPDANNGRMAVSGGSVPIGREVDGLFVVAPHLEKNDVRIELSNGEYPSIDPALGLKVRDGKPSRTWEVWLYPFVTPPRVAVQAVHVRQGVLLFAVTLEPRATVEVNRVIALASAARKQEQALQDAELARARMVRACRDRVGEQRRQKVALRAAFLPPHGPAAPQIREALDDLGIPSIALRPEEFVDPALFSVADYPILIYTSPEHYLRSVNSPGDGEAVLLEYLQRGGTLLVMGPARPFTYPDDLTSADETPSAREFALFGRRFGLDLLGPGEERGGAIGFEQPPADKLTFRLEASQDVLSGLPEQIPFPSAGDRRYRPATGDALPAGDDFTPVLTLYDDAGKRYGPAVALIRRHAPGAGGNILHVWGSLLGPDFPYADTVLHQVLTKAAELCLPASMSPAIASESPPAAAAVGILPLADEGRADLVRTICRSLNQDCADVPPDAFVDRTRFTAERFPIAVHAPKAEAFVNTWRLPGDGAEAYVRYVEDGGFLIACGNATQFWYPSTWTKGEWQLRHPLEPVMLQALALPIEQGFERPPGKIFLEPADGQASLIHARTDVSFLSDQRWRALMPTRSGSIELTPLAYLTDEGGHRYEGCAAALIRHHNGKKRPGTILYIWGNLIDGDLGEPLLRAALQLAVSDVQTR
jgi:hypothetical protein